MNRVSLVKIRKNYGTSNKVGKTIIRLRKERGWKQHELLAKLQVRGITFTQTTLSEIEGQIRQIKYEELKAFSDIFEIPMTTCLKRTRRNSKGLPLLREPFFPLQDGATRNNRH